MKEPSLPWLGDGSAFLVGGFAIDSEKKRYNTAFAVYPDGSVPVPLFQADLDSVRGIHAVFVGLSLAQQPERTTRGSSLRATRSRSFPIRCGARTGPHTPPKVAPLICYEDTVTGPARDATRQGAELLVNLTYDTWFGRSAAPYQHHLIAIFRAIENRRFLIRSTYTGYTAVVNPLGKTIAHIPAFSEGKLTVDVTLMNYQSSYTNYVGELPWWGLLALSVGSIVAGRRKKATQTFELIGAGQIRTSL